MPQYTDQIANPGEAVHFGMSLLYEDAFHGLKGKFIFDMRDGATGEQLVYFEKDNIIVKDAGILLASLCKNDAVNPAGVTMLAVGTGATGNILAPDAPQDIQRKLFAELARKAFSSKQYRNASGVAVSYRTNIVDFTATFSEGEAVGALNEMGLLSPANPAGPVANLPAGAYDSTVDVTGKDLLLNYTTFGVITKPATATLSLTWRITF